MIIKLFVIASILFFIILLLGKIFFYGHKNRFVKEKSVMISTFFMIFYIVISLITVFHVKPMTKPVILFCALSPFIIGHYASFKKLTFFTVLQLIVIVFGILILMY